MKRLVRARGLAIVAAGAFATIGIVLVSVWPRGADRGSETAATKALPSPPAVPRISAPEPPAVPTPEIVAPAPRRVVIISEDGLRPDALTPELTPRHIALMKEGATAKLAETIPESDTLPSHAAMLSGFGAAEHGLWWNSYQATRGYIHVPTIFSAAHERGLSTAMFVGKPKLLHIASPGTVDHFERPSYLCAGVAERAAEYFVAWHPELMFVHFSDPDEYGHSDGWMSPRYQRAVHASDACLDTMLSAIDTSGLAGTTLVIVTADHGGEGKRHSDGRIAVDREIPWIVRGPRVPPGTVLRGTIETVDTAATTLAALGLPALPHMHGESRFSFPSPESGSVRSPSAPAQR